MQKGIVIHILIVIHCILMLTSCEYDYIEPVKVSAEDTVSFSNDIIPIFENSCLGGGCHSTGGISPDLTSTNAYNELFAKNQIDTLNPASSVLYEKIISTGSMKNYTTPTEVNLILEWIKQGAKNN